MTASADNSVRHAHAPDTGVERIAQVYAQAIIEAADKRGCRDEVIAELESLVRDVLPKVPRAVAVFASPRVATEQKDALIDRIAAGRMLPTTVHSLHVLARHGRLGIVAEVARAARRLAEQLAGRRQAVFTTALPLSGDDQRRLVTEVEQAVGVPLAPAFAVDPALIGVLVVRIGDTVYDQSIATGLARLGGNLHRRTIHEIQHGRNRLASA
jgi:F-type H+-transporting ATPase subunit delta